MVYSVYATIKYLGRNLRWWMCPH